MTAWLLDHDFAVQGVAAATLLLVAGLFWWWSRDDRPGLHELGAMSRDWLSSRDRFRNSGVK